MTWTRPKVKPNPRPRSKHLQMAVKPAQLAHAILTSAVDGSYPDSEDVSGAELTVDTIPEIVRFLQKAREDVQASFLLPSHVSFCD